MSQGFGRHHSVIIPEYAQMYPMHRIFVETGTASAETTEKMLPYFDLLYTVDIDPANTIGAVQKFGTNPKVVPVCADSEFFLPLLANSLGKPAIFFLDAHWDHDAPHRRGNQDTPLTFELQTLLPSDLRHVILIDDARFILFGDLRDPEYPDQEWVAKIADQHGYDFAAADDVIRLTPR